MFVIAQEVALFLIRCASHPLMCLRQLQAVRVNLSCKSLWSVELHLVVKPEGAEGGVAVITVRFALIFIIVRHVNHSALGGHSCIQCRLMI